jgi:hypothetical protein
MEWEEGRRQPNLLNGEGSACRKLEELASRWWEGVTAAIMLEPPLGLRKLVQWIYCCVGIRIVDGGVTPLAVHACSPCRGVCSREAGKPKQYECRNHDDWGAD